MLRPYLPSWVKDERNEFALEVLSAFSLVFSTVWYVM